MVGEIRPGSLQFDFRSSVVVVFIKQIISASASNPQNNFGSGSETLVKCSIFFLFVGGCSAGWSSCTEAG